jgi:hypothetical protein
MELRLTFWKEGTIEYEYARIFNRCKEKLIVQSLSEPRALMVHQEARSLSAVSDQRHNCEPLQGDRNTQRRRNFFLDISHFLRLPRK